MVSIHWCGTGNPGGVPNAEINTAHTVLDSGLRYFTM